MLQQDRKYEFLYLLLLSISLSTCWMQYIITIPAFSLVVLWKRSDFACFFSSSIYLFKEGSSRLQFWKTNLSKVSKAQMFFQQLNILHQLSWSAEYHLGKPVACYCPQLLRSPKDSGAAWTSRPWSLLLLPGVGNSLKAILHLNFFLSQGTTVSDSVVKK